MTAVRRFFFRTRCLYASYRAFGVRPKAALAQALWTASSGRVRLFR
jgi:hypothetical protein